MFINTQLHMSYAYIYVHMYIYIYITNNNVCRMYLVGPGNAGRVSK